MEDLNYLINAMNVIIPANEISINDFRSLKPDFVLRFFQKALIYIESIVSLSGEYPFQNLESKSYLHNNINVILLRYNKKHGTNLRCGILDLLKPSSNTECFMRIFMNFIIVLHEQALKVQKGLEEAREKKLEMEDLKLLIDKQKDKLNNVLVKNHDLLEGIEKAERKNTKLTTQWKNLKEEDDSETKKKFLMEQMDILLNLKNETDSLKESIQVSTENYNQILSFDKLQADLQNLKINLAENTKLCNELEQRKIPDSTILSNTNLIECLETLNKQVSVDSPNELIKEKLATVIAKESESEKDLTNILEENKELENTIAKSKIQIKNSNKDRLKKLQEMDIDLQGVLEEQQKAKAMVKSNQGKIVKIEMLNRIAEQLRERIKKRKIEAIELNEVNMNRLKNLIWEVDEILYSPTG